jgi:hypothetical protein
LRYGREIQNGEGNHVWLDALSRAQVTAGNLGGVRGNVVRRSVDLSVRLLLHALEGYGSVPQLNSNAGEAPADRIAASPKAKECRQNCCA